MYYFITSDLEKGGFQEKVLKDQEYLGRVETKDKYLYSLTLFGTILSDLYKENIVIGDLYNIKDQKIIEILDSLHSIEDNLSKKEKIFIMYNNRTVESYTYISTDTMEEITKVGIDIINEYTFEMKFDAQKRLLMISHHEENKEYLPGGKHNPIE